MNSGWCVKGRAKTEVLVGCLEHFAGTCKGQSSGENAFFYSMYLFKTRHLICITVFKEKNLTQAIGQYKQNYFLVNCWFIYKLIGFYFNH